MLFLRSSLSFIVFVLLSGCSSAPATTTAYATNPTDSDAYGRPPDSAVFYFSAADSLSNVSQLTGSGPNQTVESCRFTLDLASSTLFLFQAPVLSSHYTGQPVYRFLWLRSFHRPVLLTLQQHLGGATLRTQFLTKSALSVAVTVSRISFQPPATTFEENKMRQEALQAALADSAYQASDAKQKLPAVQVLAEETAVAVTPEQWQHFETLLQKANFWQTPSCQPLGATDGAEWLLEGHQANRYHMVLRQSPGKKDAFRAGCAYLLDLSSAHKEERY